VSDQDAQGLRRFAVIKYTNEGKFGYSARRYNDRTSSYICQLEQQQGLFKLH